MNATRALFVAAALSLLPGLIAATWERRAPLPVPNGGFIAAALGWALLPVVTIFYCALWLSAAELFEKSVCAVSSKACIEAIFPACSVLATTNSSAC